MLRVVQVTHLLKNDCGNMKKIMIIGCGGSGKSTLAQQLASKLNVPLYHLDHYFWKPGWQQIDQIEFLEIQYELVSQDAWIIDGNAIRTLSVRIFEADTVIILDIPRWQCIYNIFYRQWRDYGKDGKFMAKECPIKFDKNFWRFLWYTWHFKKRFHPIIFQYMKIAQDNASIYHLRSYEEIAAFLQTR